MEAKEMLEKVQQFKEEAVYNLITKGDGEMPEGLKEFFEDNWVQVLDILDDVICAYLGVCDGNK